MLRTNEFDVDVENYVYTTEIVMPNTPITQTLEVFAGDTPTLTFNLTAKGVPYDLTGSEVTFSAKTSLSASSYLFQEQGVTTTPTTGVVEVDFPYVSNGDAGSYIAELKIVNTVAQLTLTAMQWYLDINESVQT